MLDRVRSEPQAATTWLLVAFTAIALYLWWVMVAPFVSVLTWAAALAIAFNPLRRLLLRRWPKTAVASLVVALVAAAGIAIAAVLSRQIALEFVRAQQAIRAAAQTESWRRLLDSQPWLASAWNTLQPQSADVAQQATAAIASRIGPAVTRSAVAVSKLVMTLFVLFFVVRDQEPLLATVRQWLPLSDAEYDIAAERVSAAVRGSLYGRVFIGMLQGAVGGVLFFAAGIPGGL